MSRDISRRQALLAGGTLATATTFGIVVSSDNASATVDGDFSIPDGETVLADQTLEDIRLSVDATYEYTSNADIHGIELELHVGATTETPDLIARHTRDDLGADELAGSETLNGSLMSASDFSIGDFEPSNGEVRRTIVADLRFYALRNGEVVADATHTETFDVVVNDEELEVNVTLGGEGEVVFETAD